MPLEHAVWPPPLGGQHDVVKRSLKRCTLPAHLAWVSRAVHLAHLAHLVAHLAGGPGAWGLGRRACAAGNKKPRLARPGLGMEEGRLGG